MFTLTQLPNGDWQSGSAGLPTHGARHPASTSAYDRHHRVPVRPGGDPI